MRILLAGDWHGNRGWAERCFAIAAATQCGALLQLGDFGLWPGREDAWLDHVDRLAADAGTPLVWIDGNHENHDALDAWRDKADDRGMVAMRDHVTWASRGARWEWEGVRFGALGGAVSVDRFLRKPGLNWWPLEVPTQSDVDRLGDDRLDVLVTHAAPSTNHASTNHASTNHANAKPLRLPKSILDDIHQVRDLLDQVVERTQPRLVVHGHYHVRHTAQMGTHTVEGLAHDKSPQAEMTALATMALPDLQLERR